MATPPTSARELGTAASEPSVDGSRRAVDAAPRSPAHLLSRFPPGSRGFWKDVPDALWNDWHWQQRERVTRLDQLEKVVRLTEDERRAVIETDAEFHMGITPYYAALMDPEDPSCPIRLQSVPTLGELAPGGRLAGAPRPGAVVGLPVVLRRAGPRLGGLAAEGRRPGLVLVGRCHGFPEPGFYTEPRTRRGGGAV